MGFVISNVLSEFSRELRELPWQPKLGKISQSCTNFNFCKKSRNFKHVNTGLLNSNIMLPEFSTEPRESPWQPKLCKNKPKFRRIQFSKSYGDNVCVYGGVFVVGEFKYANKNFRGAKQVAIATKFTQKGQKCTDFSSVCNIVPISTYMIGELLWHQIGKNKPKLYKFQFCIKY